MDEKSLRLHEDYLKADANVVETNTYQICESDLGGLQGANVEELAQSAVETHGVAVRHHGARQLQDGAVESEIDIRRALSLGPYAVALADGSEVCLPLPMCPFFSNLPNPHPLVHESLSRLHNDNP